MTTVVATMIAEAVTGTMTAVSFINAYSKSRNDSAGVCKFVLYFSHHYLRPDR